MTRGRRDAGRVEYWGYGQEYKTIGRCQLEELFQADGGHSCILYNVYIPPPPLGARDHSPRCANNRFSSAKNFAKFFVRQICICTQYRYRYRLESSLQAGTIHVYLIQKQQSQILHVVRMLHIYLANGSAHLYKFLQQVGSTLSSG